MKTNYTLQTFTESNAGQSNAKETLKSTNLKKILQKIVMFSIAFVIVNFLLANISYGQKTWDGGGDGTNWSSGNNWNPDGLPASTDAVTLIQGQTVNVDITTAVCAALNLSPTGAGTATLQFTNGSKLTASGIVTLGQSGNTNRIGALNMTNSGTLSCQGLALGNAGANTFTPGTGKIELTANNTLPSTIFTSFNNLTINGGTTTAGIGLTITGNMTITSGTFAASTYLHNIAGDWTNNGTFTQGTSTINFNGTNSLQTISGSSTSTFYWLKVTKGAQDRILEATGLIGLSAPSNPLIITSGTFKLSSASTIAPFTSNAGAVIPATGGFWNNGGTITAGAYSWGGTTAIAGLVRNTSGTFGIGSATGNSLAYAAGSIFTIEGGVVNIAGSYRGSGAISFSMSGGTLNVNNVGNTAATASFDISNAGSTFTMSNGTIIINNENTNAAPLDYRNIAGTVNITGGTVQFGTAATTGSPTYVVGVTGTTNILPSLSLVKAATSTTVTIAAPVTINGNVTVPTGTTFAAASQAISVTGNASPGTFVGDWTLGGTFTPGTQTVTFNSTSAQQITGATAFSSLTLNNANGLSINNDVTINGTLTFTSGKITTAANKLILANAATVSGAGTGWVIGNLQQGFASGVTSYTFAIGNAGNYLPSILNFAGTGTTNATGKITASTTNGQQLNYATSGLSQSKYINRYWTLTNSGVTINTTYGATFTFVNSSDYIGSPTIASLVVKKYDGSWSLPTQGTPTATTIACSGLSTFSDFAAGEDCTTPSSPTTATMSPSSPACAGQTLTLSGAASGGTDAGCTIEYQYSTDNGVNWSTPGSSIPSFTAVTGNNIIQARRNTCSTGCGGTYPTAWNTVASWTVNALPSAPGVGTITQPSCTTATASVELSGLPSGNWTINPGAIAGSTTTTTLSGLAAGSTHTYTVTNSDGCTSVASAAIVINTIPAPPSAPIVGTIIQPSCTTASTSVELSGLPSGNWTINPGTIAGSTITTTLSGLTAGNHNYTVTDANGCTSTASANVNIASPPENAPVTSVSNVSICDGATFVDIPVTVAGFTNSVSGISLTMTYDPLQLGTPTLQSNPLGLTLNLPSDGVIKIGGFAPAGQGYNLTGNTLVIIRFTKATPITAGNIAFDDANGVDCEYSKYDPADPFAYLAYCDNPASTYYISGGVTVNPLPTASISGNNSPICAGNIAVFILSGTTNAIVTYSLDGGASTSTITLTGGTATITVNNAVVNQTLSLIAVADANCSQGLTATSTVTVNPLPYDLQITNGLQAFYSFSGNANDESPNHYNGTVYNATLTSDRNANANSAYSFNGSNTYIDLGDQDNLNPHLGSITVSAWAKKASLDQHARIFSKGTSGGIQTGYALMFYGGGYPTPAAVIFNANGHEHVLYSDNPINDLLWHHYAAVINRNGNINLYVDGVKQNNFIDISDHASIDIGVNTYNATIGASYSNYGSPGPVNEFFNGNIDEVAVYNRALSDNEVKTLYYQKPRVDVAANPICYNTSTMILLNHSQNGISYQLKKNGSDEDVAQTGNGNTLTFSTGILTSNASFTFLATDPTSGCTNLLDPNLTITVNPLPTVSIDGNNSSICSGNNAVFNLSGTADAVVTYSLNGGSTTSTTTLTGGSAIVTVNNASSDQTLTLINVTNPVTNCSQALTVTSTVTVNPVPVFSISGNNIVCAGSTEEYLNPPVVNTVVWSVSGGTINSGYTNISDPIKIDWGTGSTASITATETNGYGCSTTHTMDITINPLPTASIDGNNDPICAGNTAIFLLSGTSGAVVTYSMDGGISTSTLTLSSGTSYIYSNGTTTQTLTLISVSDANCSQALTATSTVTFMPFSITASAGTNGNITPNGLSTIYCGNSQTYNFTPDAHYHIADVLVDGISVGTPSSYTLNNVNANHTISVSFDIDMFTLTVTRNGIGSGIISTGDGFIHCGSTCSYSYPYGSSVNLSAIADATSNFDGWGGSSCSGTSGCTLTMDGDKSVSATFSRILYTLTVNYSGSGSVSSSPSGISCGSTCSALYVTGTLVTLTATPASGYHFTGWTGGCSGTGSCNILMDASKSVTAHFELDNHTVSFNANGGNGTMSNQVSAIAANLTINTFTQNCFSFTGWNTLANGSGTAYNDGQSYSFAADLTLYAQWLANTPIIPVFTALGPYCQNSAPATLAGISNNAITGSWNPATITTAIGGTTTYTFTPDAGQCATTNTMTVLINELPTASISGNNSPICSGNNAVFNLSGTTDAIVTYSLNGGTTTATTTLTGGSAIVTVYNAIINQTLSLISVTDANCSATLTASSTVTVNEKTAHTTTVTTCDSYTWAAPLGNGNTYTASVSGITHESTNAEGCTHTETLNLTINHSSAHTTTVTTCDTYTWAAPLGNGNTYTASVSGITHESTNAEGCTHTETLNLTITHSTAHTTTVTTCDSYTWAPPLGDGNTYTSTGIYTHASTNGSGCTHTETLNLTINPLPTASISGNNSPVCSGNNAVFYLSGTTNAVVTYSLNGGTTTATIILTGGSATVTVNAATANQTLTLITVKNSTTNCSKALTATSTVTVNPKPTLATVTTSPVCEGNTTTVVLTGLLPGVAGVVYYTIGANATSTLSFTADAGGTFSFASPVLTLADDGLKIRVRKLTVDGTNCETNFALNAKIANLNVRPNPTLATVTAAPVCEGNTTEVVLTGLLPNVAGVAYYTIGADPTLIPKPGTADASGTFSFTTPLLTMAENGLVIEIKKLRVNGTNCETIFTGKTVNLVVNPLPVFSISGNNLVCAGTTEEYLNPPVSNSVVWSVSGGTINSGYTNTSDPIKIDWGTGSTASITATETNIYGCSTTHTMDITINPLPTASISGNNSPICAGNNAVFTLTGTPSAIVTYSLDGGITTATTTLTGGTATITIINAIVNQTLTLISVNDVNCSQPLTATSTITVNPLPKDIVKSNGLVAYYPFNNNANDESGNGNNGTLSGPVSVADRNSNPNSAYYFNGYNNYILVNDPVPASLQIQNEITLSAWIYATQYPGYNHLGLIVGSQCDACGHSGASIFLDGRTDPDGITSPAGHIHFQIGDGAGWHHSNSNSQVPLNQWVHIVATRKANEAAKIYYNGVLQPVNGLSWNGNIDYSGAFFAMGRQKDISDRYFKGSMDEVRVYNKALSLSEVYTLYQSSLTVNVSSTSICENDAATIQLLNSENGVSYQLRKSGIDVGSAQSGNGNTLTFNTGNLTSTSSFTIKATNITTNCDIVLDTIITITVNPLPTASISGNINNVCSGMNAGFTITGTTDAIVTYSLDGGTTTATTTLTGGTASITISNIITNQTLTLIAVTNPVTNCSQALTATATLTVNSLPVVSIAPAGPLAICAGSNTTLTASGSCNTYTFSLNMSGAQEVPPIISPAAATGWGTFNKLTNQLTIIYLNFGITASVTAAHIHKGAVGVNGPVITPIIGFPVGVFTGTIYNFNINIPPAEVTDLLSGNTYINIHSTLYPGGEVRSQLLMNPICTPIVSYLWSTNETTAAISVSTANTYTVTGTDANGCSSTASITVSVNPLPTASISGNNSPVCYGNNAVFNLTGTTDAIVTYSLDGGTTTATTTLTAGNATVTVNNIISDQILTLIAVNNPITNCSQALSATSTVTVNPIPTAGIIGNNGPVCSGSNAVFSLNGTVSAVVTYSFNGGTTTSTITLTGGTATVTVSNATASQTLTLVSVSKSGCSQDLTASSTVIVNQCTVQCKDTVHVSNNLDDASIIGSLRNALERVCDNGVIYFDIDCPGQTINLTKGSLIVSKNVLFEFTDCQTCIPATTGITLNGSGINITINAGKTLTLSGCTKFTLTGCIQNNNGVNGLVLNSGASFIYNCCNLPATAKRDMTNVWHLFGSPFVKNSGATLGSLYPPSGYTQMMPYTNGTGWGITTTASLFQFTPTVGYAVKPSLSLTAVLSGYLFCNSMAPNCDYYVNLVYSGTSALQSWNLVANPFPSYLNWNLLGKTSLNTTLYLWDNSLCLGCTPVTNGAYMRTYNSANNVGVPANTKPYISPMQGFFVKANYTNPKITFPLSARTHSTSPYYKEASTSIIVRLKTETEGAMDELVICKNDNSALGLENFDSEKLFTDLPLSMYSEASTGERLVINTINTTANTVIPLGLKGEAGMKAKITAFALESGEQVYLEDRLRGKLISLTENTAYEFEFPTAAIQGRFFIRFGMNTSPIANSGINVFENNSELNIIAQTGENIQTVELYSITGACIFKTTGNGNTFTQKLDLAEGVYMVRVKTSLSTQNTKVNWR
ncbi:MAG: CHRD domain-containing protein [Bacteroidetes bacterium]|nr:CHRD domain-containing protein [Bacteroidota bacterium]